MTHAFALGLVCGALAAAFVALTRAVEMLGMDSLLDLFKELAKATKVEALEKEVAELDRYADRLETLLESIEAHPALIWEADIREAITAALNGFESEAA